MNMKPHTLTASSVKRSLAMAYRETNGEKALPRTFVATGEYKGIVAPVRRAGSDSLDDAPSLYCGVRYYRDGRREKVEE